MSDQVDNTQIIYQEDQTKYVFNIDGITMNHLIIGILVIIACCIGPIIIGCIVCYCVYQKKNSQTDTDETNEQKQSDHIDRKVEGKNDIDDGDVSKLGMSATDSLKLQPGASDIYAPSPSGPVRIKIGIDASIDRSYNREGKNHLELSKLIDSMNSDTSDGMYDKMDKTTTEYTTKATTNSRFPNRGDI